MISGIRTANTDPTVPVVKLTKSLRGDSLGVFLLPRLSPPNSESLGQSQEFGTPGYPASEQDSCDSGFIK